MLSRLEPAFVASDGTKEDDKIRGDTKRTLDRLGIRSKPYNATGERKNPVQLLCGNEDCVREEAEKIILQDLELPTMRDREATVAETHPETFK